MCAPRVGLMNTAAHALGFPFKALCIAAGSILVGKWQQEACVNSEPWEQAGLAGKHGRRMPFRILGHHTWTCLGLTGTPDLPAMRPM